MDALKKILDLIVQRRIWASIISIFVFVIQILQIDYDLPDIDQLITNLTEIGVAMASLIAGLLSMWSYFCPKNETKY